MICGGIARDAWSGLHQVLLDAQYATFRNKAGASQSEGVIAMSASSIVRQPRGPRKANIGDAAAVPLMTARILHLVQIDALNGKVLASTLSYFNEARSWFHTAMRERAFPFMLPTAEDRLGKIGRRPDYFRKEAGLFVDRLVSLAVANKQDAATELTAKVRAAGERYLIARYFQLLGPHDEYQSPAEFSFCLELLKAGRTFTEVSAEPKFVQLCIQVAYDHEVRLRDFAKLTSGLCS